MHKKQTILTLACVGLLVIIAGFVTFHFVTAAQAAQPKTAFTFRAEKAPEWWAGKNNYPKEDETVSYQGSTEDLPAVALTVAQGTEAVPKNCFVNYFYWQKSVNPAAALEDMKARTTEGGGLSLREIDTHELTMNNVPYTLHQYEITGEDNDNVASGVEFAYIPYGDGYIEARGYCETVGQLPVTLPAFDAVELKL